MQNQTLAVLQKLNLNIPRKQLIKSDFNSTVFMYILFPLFFIFEFLFITLNFFNITPFFIFPVIFFTPRLYFIFYNKNLDLSTWTQVFTFLISLAIPGLWYSLILNQYLEPFLRIPSDDLILKAKKIISFYQSFANCPAELSRSAYRQLIQTIYDFYDYRHANNIIVLDTNNQNVNQLSIRNAVNEPNMDFDAHHIYMTQSCEKLHIGFIRYLEDHDLFKPIKILIKMGAASTDFPKFCALDDTKKMANILEMFSRTTSNPEGFKQVLHARKELFPLPQDAIEMQEGDFFKLSQEIFTQNWDSCRKIRDIKNNPPSEGFITKTKKFLGTYHHEFCPLSRSSGS